MTDEICYPAGTDWSCAYSDEQLSVMWADAHVAATMRRAEALAWSTLAGLTGFFFSTCPLVVRPCRKGCASGWRSWPVPTPHASNSFQPHIGVDGYWVNSCICDSDPCSCGPIHEIVLPGPVGSIVEVLIDGAMLDPAAYRVDNGNRLVRQDGSDWPMCQDMNLPSGTVGTFTVEYYRGAGPNQLLHYAAGVLATEFYLACSGGECRLPAGVTNVSRQGVNFQIATGLFTNGMTGIREVDAVVGLYNPNGLKAPPYVSSPDVRPGRVTTYGG
jgi:hypothetical protein